MTIIRLTDYQLQSVTHNGMRACFLILQAVVIQNVKSKQLEVIRNNYINHYYLLSANLFR